MYWAQQNSDGAIHLSDITFNQATQNAAQKNVNIRQYLGENFRSNSNRAARHLREIFREKQDRDYDGGKIKVVSTDRHAELRLRWVPNGDKIDEDNSHGGIEDYTR